MALGGVCHLLQTFPDFTTLQITWSNKRTSHSVMRHFTTPDHQYKLDLAQNLFVVNLIMAR
jgi:hypothetical protein